MFDPVALIRALIQWTGNEIPTTGKHINYDHQLEEELAHPHIKHTENKHRWHEESEIYLGFTSV